MRVLAVVVAALASACGEARSGSREPAHPDDVGSVLAPSHRVALQETPEDPLIDVRRLVALPDGRLVVADRRAARIRTFARDGSIERVLGRFGEGPGELKLPQGIFVDAAGTLYVVEGGSPRLSVFSADGSFDRVHMLPGYVAGIVAGAGPNLLIGMGGRFLLMDSAAAVVRTFGEWGEAIESVPYWGSMAATHAAVFGDRIVLNTSFFPTLRVHSMGGDSIGEFGTPPPSWTDAPRPERGAFIGVDGARLVREWLRSFTVVMGLVPLHDRLLIVQYGRHDPIGNDLYVINPTTFDVYEKDGAKILEDIPFERRILAGGDHVYVLEAEPPEPWTVGVYDWVWH